MAELESLQLSIEQDADEEMKSKWLRNRDRCFELNLIRKKELVKDKEVVARASASPRAVENSVSVTPKEERLSPITPTTPVKGGSLEIDKDLEKQTDNRVEGAVEDSVFPQEWSYEEQFKKVCRVLNYVRVDVRVYVVVVQSCNLSINNFNPITLLIISVHINCALSTHVCAQQFFQPNTC